MTLHHNLRILIVGLGLIGGSYAKALTKKGYCVTAITKDRASVDYSLENGRITNGADFVDEQLGKEADLVILALYPHILLSWLRNNQHLLKPGAVITDVTGVKCSIVYEVQDFLRKDVEFIAAHPMAGREVYGVQNSDDSIFQKANYIVTPTAQNTAQAIQLCEQLGVELGFAHISRLSPEQHDDMIGFLSQLTHCIAISLMNCNDTPGMEAYTGDSFRDLTRIARINDCMWSELFMCNREILLKHMDAFSETFDQFRNMLKENDIDGMRRAMRHSTMRRALFDKK